MRERNRASLNKEACIESVLEFFQKQRKFKQVQAHFNELKSKFYSDMEGYFKDNGLDGKLFIDSEINTESLTVTRVQNTKVVFDADKLEKALGKNIAKYVVLKRYEITDMDGLIVYLKECGVDPHVFKSFIAVSKNVDTQELERLEELGKINAEQIQGCYSVTRQKPYFTVNVGKGRGDDD